MSYSIGKLLRFQIQPYLYACYHILNYILHIIVSGCFIHPLFLLLLMLCCTFSHNFILFSHSVLSCVKALCCTLIKHTKNLLERMQTGFVIRTHMGKKASTDIAAFIFLVSDPQKPRNS